MVTGLVNGIRNMAGGLKDSVVGIGTSVKGWFTETLGIESPSRVFIGYVGCWRVLNAQYFGVPQQRRRVFLVAGHRQMPPIELLADAAPVEAIPPASSKIQWPRPADAWAANTLLANKAGSQIAMGCTTFVAQPNGWHQMAERQRTSENDGLCLGLDASNLAEAFAAGNAVVTQIAQWIAEKLIKAG